MKKTINVTNQENSVGGNQFNFVGDVHITNQPPARDATEPVEFNLKKPTKSFAGRDKEMDILKELFFVKNEKMVVICGNGGYGKTELARKFVHQCKEDEKITHILWMEAESEKKLRESFQKLATELQLPKRDYDNSLVKMIYQYLEPRSYIIVFDNAINRKQILDFEPTEGSYHCLVTSHVEDWEDDVPPLKLQQLPLKDAVNVLHAVLGKRFKAEDVALYEELATNVSCVPLALQVTAAYTREEMRDLEDDFNLREHVQNVKKFFENIIDHPVPDSNTYNNTVSKAIQLSFEKINSLNTKFSNLACDILKVCAYLYSDQILHSDLMNISCLKEFLKDSKDLKRALSLLSNYSFISKDIGKITIHRLVQITVIYQQKNLENLNHYYISCLELLLLNNDISKQHRNSILQYAENHLREFLNFYSRNKSIVISDNSFLFNLVCTGCELYLKEIFDQLNDQAAGIINKYCLLHDAAEHKQHVVLEVLLARDADVNTKRLVDEKTALNVAAEELDLPALKLLVEHKADVNVADKNDFTVLHRLIFRSARPEFAGRSEEVREVLRWLAKHGANTEAVAKRGEILLHVAAGVLSVDLISFLVDEFSQSVHAETIYKQTPIYYVSITHTGTGSKERRLRTAACLVELGARLDHKDVYSQTPAEFARLADYEYIARYLCNPSAGYIDIQITEQHSDKLKALVSTGQTASLKEVLDQFEEAVADKINEYCLLHEAVRYRACDMVELLLDRGADINYCGDGNITPLHTAAMFFDLPVMQMLVSREADVTAIAPGGKSILYFLIWYLKVEGRHEACEVLRWLVECGARTDVVLPDGRSLLHVAAYNQRTDVIECLIRDFHLDVNAPDEDGLTPVFYVISGVREQVADEAQGIRTAACLFELKAQFDVKVLDKTPANMANINGFSKLEEYLEHPVSPNLAVARHVDVNGFTPTEDAHVSDLSPLLDYSVDQQRADAETGAGSRRWRWNSTYVGVGVAAAAATVLQIYRHS